MNIDIVTAPEHRHFYKGDLKVFLAGGICKCIEWQKMIIDMFNESNEYNKISLCPEYDTLCVINPRRTDWIDEPNAALRQIEWEFDMIEKCDMFTMYFAGGESDQPICMYELGRNIERFKQRFPLSWQDRIIITCDDSYKRLNDVLIQTMLATNNDLKVNVVIGAEESVKEHFKKIEEKLKYIYPEY